MSLFAVLAVIYGIKQAAEGGFGSVAGLSIAAGVVVGVLFVRRQQALADPLLDLRLFRLPAFSASVAANTLAIFIAAGAFLFIAQYLQLVLGLSPLKAGLWLLPSAAAFIVGSMLAPSLVRRAPAGQVVGAGLILAAVGLATLTRVEAGSGLVLIVVGSVVTDLGLALVLTLSTGLIVGSAPPERAGAASAISETGAELGGALGIAILGSIGTAVYRSQVADAIPPNAPPHAAAAARETLAGAVAGADDLPPTVLHAAGEAFTQGLQLAAGTSAALAATAAIFALLRLRAGRRGAEARRPAQTPRLAIAVAPSHES